MPPPTQELAAIDEVYGAGAGRGADAPLLIGSVKSNMGHAEGCSGLAGCPPSRRRLHCPCPSPVAHQLATAQASGVSRMRGVTPADRGSRGAQQGEGRGGLTLVCLCAGAQP